MTHCWFCHGVILERNKIIPNPATMSRCGNVPCLTSIVKCDSCGAAYHVQTMVENWPTISLSELERRFNAPDDDRGRREKETVIGGLSKLLTSRVPDIAAYIPPKPKGV
jgi:hypothetical protein